MRYAKSLFYNVIVDAEESGYKDYINWMLRCPRCGEPVYWMAGAVRKQHERHLPKTRELIKVKEAIVSPSFAHFKGLGDENCDNFSATITPAYITKVTAVSRGQRLEIFNNHFLELLGYTESSTGHFFTLFKSANNCNNKLAKGALDSVVSDFRDLVIFLPVDTALINCRKLLSEIKDSTYREKILISGKSVSTYYQTFLDWVNTFDVDMQVSIIKEVLFFLKTSAAKKIYLQLFEFSFNRYITFVSESDVLSTLSVNNKTDSTLKSDYDRFLKNLCALLTECIALNDWYGGVQKISAR